MNRSTQGHSMTEGRGNLAVYHAPLSVSNIARWRINGFPAVILVWTADEWERLAVRPDDAQYYPCGVLARYGCCNSSDRKATRNEARSMAREPRGLRLHLEVPVPIMADASHLSLV